VACIVQRYVHSFLSSLAWILAVGLYTRGADITPVGAHETHPHPAAPKEIVEKFQDFLTKFRAGPSSSASSSSSSSSSNGEAKKKDVIYDEFWLAPRRFWGKRDLGEAEIEAVEVRCHSTCTLR
jgi:small subunit ribosomal protein YMR-31